MTNSNSPFLTDAPGLKFTCSKNPATRARRSTDRNASVVPVVSTYCVTRRSTGCATVTAGGGGGANELDLRSQPTRTKASSASPRVVPRRGGGRCHHVEQRRADEH